MTEGDRDRLINTVFDLKQRHKKVTVHWNSGNQTTGQIVWQEDGVFKVKKEDQSESIGHVESVEFIDEGVR